MANKLLFLLFLHSQVSFAQSIVYLDENKQETSRKKAKYALTYEQKGDLIFSQNILLIESGGLVIEEMELTSIAPQIKHGSYQKFYNSGQLQTTGKYFDNKKFGIWKDYYENGQMECIYTVVNDTSHYMQYWTKEGETVLVDGNGTLNYKNEHLGCDMTVEFVDNLRYSMYFTYFGSSDTIYNQSQKQPEFQDGLQAFYRFVGQGMTYPVEARRKGIQGKVYVQLVINESGQTEYVEVLKGIGSGCDEVAKRVIEKTSGKWIPGEHEGKAVKVRMVLPLVFKLSS